MYRFNTNAIKLSMAFFTGIKHKKLKFLWKHKRFQIAKTIDKNRAGRSMLPDFHTYTHRVEYYSAIKNNKMFPFSAKWPKKF